MKCFKCGEEIDDTAAICPKCGEIQDVVNDEHTETTKRETTPEEKEKLKEIQARRDAKRLKERKKRIAGVCALVAMIIVVAGVGLWLIARSCGLFDGKVVEPMQSVAPIDDILEAKDSFTGKTIKALKVKVNDKNQYFIETEIDKKKYYVRINEGTKDDQIKDCYFIADGHPDKEYICDGKVAYVIENIVRGGTKDTYILPFSSERLLTKDDIAGLEARELFVARNEIYARHGSTFNDDVLNEYFKTKSWYEADMTFENSVVEDNEIEYANVLFIKQRENELEVNP